MSTEGYSVLMSVYRNDTLAQLTLAVNDIKLQTVGFEEFVIIVDGPVDLQVEEFLRGDLGKGFRVIWLTENLGLGRALNIGLNVIKSEFILRMDADDRCSCNRAESLLVEIKNNKNSNVAVVGSNIVEFETNINNIVGKIIYRTKTTGHYDTPINYWRDFVGHASVMMRTDALSLIGGYKHCLYFEDTYLFLRLLNKGYSLLSLNKDLYYARVERDFYNRRSGFSYLKSEFAAFCLFRDRRLITKKSFIINLFIRPIIRLMPKRLVGAFYRNFLRN